MKICMIGTGYVGLVSGTCFADLGNKVFCVDKDKIKINKLKNIISPIYEPGLDDLIRNNVRAKRLNFTNDLEKAVKESQIIFICVGTPTKKGSNMVDLSQVFNVAKSISKYIKNYKIIVNKSTVPVSTGDQIEKIILKKVKRSLFDVISNPEFLREGDAIRDFKYPDRIVIGSDNKKVFKKMQLLYEPLIKKGAKFFSTSRKGAELVKYASNAFLATKITFINEIANLCENTGINVEDISVGMGSDARIGGRFLRAGPAYGGSCFPKDTKGLISIADKFKTNLSIVKSVIKSNQNRKVLLTKRIAKIMNNKIKNKKITILGVTFKANTDDMRESSSLVLIPYLLKRGGVVKYHDPSGFKKEFKKNKNLKFERILSKACLGADLIIINTEWDEFKSIDFKKVVKKENFKIYDMRNLYNPEEMRKKKIKYFSIGR
jgi:UDPglucose 6-dehydrogenase